jgi:hypothetical protein
MRWGFLSVALLSIGCQTPPALRPPVYKAEKVGEADDQDTPPPKAPNPWLDCYAGFRTTGDERADASRLAHGCENGQLKLTSRNGTQSEQGAAQRYTFAAGGPHKCYRVYAVGGAGVAELDAMVRGPDGEPLARDESSGPFAVVPAATALCLPQEGVYTLEVSVFRGKGPFAVELWSGE